MKKGILLMVAGLVLVGTVAFAIPNSVGVNNFQNPAGMRFEEFAVREASWKQDAKLLGEWTTWSDKAAANNTEVMKLTLTAVVFGLNAELVTVYRKNETVQKFRVDFADGEKTEKALRRNLALWADGKWDANGKTITHAGTTITLGEGNVVEFVVK